jgi:hypothetical protein
LDKSSSAKGYSGPVAADYPECLSIVEERVKPERQKRKENGEYALRKPLPQKWWVFNCPRFELYSAIEGFESVLVGVAHTKHWSVSIASTETILSHAIVVFAIPCYAGASILESNLHECWARYYSGSLETRLRYSPSDCFDTFPLPPYETSLEGLGKEYIGTRGKLMLERDEGLTDVLNAYHDSSETSTGILGLRSLRVEIDCAVASAYGWSDLKLGHGLHETKQGTRFTISEDARREVLARLLKLNHERYAEEVAQGLHSKTGGGGRVKGGGKKTGTRATKGNGSSEPNLFGEEE